MSAPTAIAAHADRRRRLRRARAAVVVIVACVAVGAAAWAALLRDGAPSPGPLRSLETSSGGFGRTAGKPFGFGLAIVWNTGGRPAVLEGIEPVDPTPGLRVLETHVAGPDRKYMGVAATREWPADEFSDLHPVRGFTVAPNAEPAGERGVELVLALRADKPGRYEFKAIAVDYTVEGERHRAYIRNGLGVCVTAPSEPTVRGCKAPRGLTEDT